MDDMAKRGIEFVHIYGVDNALVQIADPVFVGSVAETGADVGNKSCLKEQPHEPVGVICIKNGKYQVRECWCSCSLSSCAALYHHLQRTRTPTPIPTQSRTITLIRTRTRTLRRPPPPPPTQVVEYSEMDDATCELRRPDGELLFSAGNVCNHMYDTSLTITNHHAT